MPWVSTPRRSASTSALAMMTAFPGGTLFASRSLWAKERAEDWETWSLGVWSCDEGVDIVGKGEVLRLMLGFDAWIRLRK